MTASIIGLSANIRQPSKTRVVVEHLVGRVSAATGLDSAVLDFQELGAELGGASSKLDASPRVRAALEAVESASAIVVGSPTYKGSYSGLFKHFFDLVDMDSLVNKPVLLSATGGGYRHALMVEHQMRPLFAFFNAMTIPTAIYVSEQDFTEGEITNDVVLARFGLATKQMAALLPAQTRRLAASL